MFAVVVLLLGAQPAPEFVVENKCPPVFMVTNRVPALPTDPSQPAPPGYQWQRWPGGTWKLYPVEVSRQAVPFGRGTTVQSVAGASTSSLDSTEMGRTRTLAPQGIPGVTNCSPSG